MLDSSNVPRGTLLCGVRIVPRGTFLKHMHFQHHNSLCVLYIDKTLYLFHNIFC